MSESLVRFTFPEVDADGDPTGDTIEVEVSKTAAEAREPVPYFVPDDSPMIANPDGTTTTLETTATDPREEPGA